MKYYNHVNKINRNYFLNKIEIEKKFDNQMSPLGQV